MIPFDFIPAVVIRFISYASFIVLQVSMKDIQKQTEKLFLEKFYLETHK